MSYNLYSHHHISHFLRTYTEMDEIIITRLYNYINMQELTCKIFWNPIFSKWNRANLKNIKQIEILEVLKENRDKGQNVGICKIVMEEDQPLSHIKFSKYYEILEIIEKNNCEYTCMVRVSTPPYFLKFLELMDLDIIWQCPIIMNKDYMSFKCIGSASSLDKVIKLFKLMGTITQISYNDAVYNQKNNRMLSSLTQKELVVLQIAMESGYYEYPRKINGTELARKIKSSKSTVIEHLRKAENKVMISALKRD